MSKKKNLGQFYTTNSNYITNGLLDIFPDDGVIIDPFAGNFDLLNLVKNKNEIIAYDIDPKNKETIKKDTLLNPPDYKGLWIFTNPPYLAKNKNKDKTLYDKYLVDDLYKAFMLTIFESEGGVIIVPANFFTSNDKKIRKKFLSKFEVKKVKIFEESVFDDTDLSVVAFSFVRKDNEKQNIEFVFYPSNVKIEDTLYKKSGYTIGSELENLKKGKIKASRLLIGEKPNTNIFLRAIDTGSEDGRIKLEYKEDHFYGKSTDRSFATITLSENISEEDQKRIIKEFNNRLENYRSKYNSLFLTNFRNSSNGKARKRIGFRMAYNIIDNIIFELNIKKMEDETDEE